ENIEDDDLDDDGVANNIDDFPNDPTESVDTDNDGIGNNADTDDDNDGYSDVIEIAENTNPIDNSSTPADLDGDFIPDSTDQDIDGDGVVNADDAFPEDSTETLNFDGDSLGDNADPDDDNDGFDDTDDAFPFNSAEWLDTDNDEIGNNSDNCVSAYNQDQADLDADGIGDVCDDDRDGDGVLNVDDAFPDNPLKWDIETGIDDVADVKISLYPNPVRDVLNIQTDENITSVEVIDFSGRIVKKFAGNNQIFVGDIPSGVYFVKIATDKNYITKRVIKK
ncbi:MAG: T9SS type A sorting domain-containing protein, partial [Minisyncoccia bacterium]